MIPVKITAVFFFYIFFLLIWILGTWIYYEYKWKAKKYVPPEKKMFRCLICAHIYLDDRDRKISQCPRCRSYNDLSPSSK